MKFSISLHRHCETSVLLLWSNWRRCNLKLNRFWQCLWTLKWQDRFSHPGTQGSFWTILPKIMVWNQRCLTNFICMPNSSMSAEITVVLPSIYISIGFSSLPVIKWVHIYTCMINHHLFWIFFVIIEQNYLNGLWGKLASEILMQNWDTALEDLNRLKEYIDTNTFNSPLEALQQRTWLIHWSLFIFFNHAKGRDLIVEMFLYQSQ